METSNPLSALQPSLFSVDNLTSRDDIKFTSLELLRATQMLSPAIVVRPDVVHNRVLEELGDIDLPRQLVDVASGKVLDATGTSPATKGTLLVYTLTRTQFIQVISSMKGDAGRAARRFVHAYIDALEQRVAAQAKDLVDLNAIVNTLMVGGATGYVFKLLDILSEWTYKSADGTLQELPHDDLPRNVSDAVIGQTVRRELVQALNAVMQRDATLLATMGAAPSRT